MILVLTLVWSSSAEAIPLGLWDNGVNGTTAFQIAAFLEKNKFNAVRLPLMATYILENTKPNPNLINTFKNRAVSVKNYMELLKSIVKVLQHRNIGIMLSMHTLTKTDKGELWYNSEVPEEKFLESIDILTKNLCTNEYWNVMGIDLKNEPSTATWGDDGPADFRAGAKRIADRMLKGCPKWMGFVEGIYTKHEMQLDGERYWYFDWYGGGLQGAKNQTVTFSVPNKVVWAPHYYTPAVFPQAYLYGGGSLGGENTKGENGLVGYVELSDEKLRSRVKATTDDMFGFLATETGAAIVLGEFGGIYATDAHPMKTTKRTTDYTIELITKPGWAGGFVWSLNPESEYQYNPADKPGRFFEGALQIDWLTENTEFIKGLAHMDTMENLRPFPCFPAAAKV
jgi:endoglucanase